MMLQVIRVRGCPSGIFAIVLAFLRDIESQSIVPARHMATTSKGSFSYRFGPFLVDAPAGQLRKGATKVRLAGQPFDILLMLLERPGQVVTREEIQTRLWPQETFVDFENSLNKAINKLRQALSDSAEKPVYIETLPRRGYRFIGTLTPPVVEPVVIEAPVLAPPEEPKNSAPTIANGNTTPEISRFHSLWRVAALSILLPLALLAWLAARPSPVPRVLGAVPLTTSSRVDLYGGLHTDGVRLYFLVRRGHKWELSQMPVAGGEVQPISLPFPNARLLSVSPDGSLFALGPFDSRARELPVWIMSSVGGTPRRLGDLLVNDATFTRDGKRITYSTAKGIFEIDTDGANGRKLAEIPGDKWSLAWSPDGKRLRFHWLNLPGTPSQIWELHSDGSNLHQILADWKEVDGLCCGRWTADGRYFLFLAASNNASASIWALREPTGLFRRRSAPVRLSTEPLPVSSFLPSSDGRRVFLLGNNTRTEYVRADAKTKQIRGLIGGKAAAWTTFAASGDWLVYRGPGNALWRSNLDGSAAVEIISAKFDPRLPAISPDGKMVAFRGQPADITASRIYVVPSSGGEPVEVASAKLPLLAPAFSPDGSKLSYAVDEDSDPSTGVYIYDFSTKASQKLPGSELLWRHSWSPDGKYLAGVSLHNDTISLYNFATKKWKILARGRVFSPAVWSPDSQFLYYQDVLEEGEPIHRLRLSDLSVTTAFECRLLLEGGVQRCGFEGLAPDGSFVLQLSRGDHDIYSLDVDLP